MKRPLALFLILVLAAALAVPASAVVQQSDEFYVADYAGILSQETEKLIIGYNAVLEQQCSGAQIVVVTISGRGDKDCAAIARYRGEDIHE